MSELSRLEVIGMFVEISAVFLLDVLVAIGLRLYNVHCKLYMLIILYKVDGVLVEFHRYGLPDLGDNYVN